MLCTGFEPLNFGTLVDCSTNYATAAAHRSIVQTGATTPSIAALSITALSITALSITALSITALSITVYLRH